MVIKIDIFYVRRRKTIFSSPIKTLKNKFDLNNIVDECSRVNFN
jgi:hypothetical protein